MLLHKWQNRLSWQHYLDTFEAAGIQFHCATTLTYGWQALAGCAW